MPITPYHFGPAFVLGLLLNRFINLTTFIIANVIIDIEPFVVLVFNLDYPVHGFFHSFLGGSIAAVILSLVIITLNVKIQKLTNFLKIKQNFSAKAICVASFLGIYLHILLDAPLYTDIKPFYPLDINPFYDIVNSVVIYIVCAVLLLVGILTYFLCYLRRNKTSCP